MCAATAYAATAEVDDDPYQYSDDGDFESDDTTELDEPEAAHDAVAADSSQSQSISSDSAASRDSHSASSSSADIAAAPPAAVAPAEASRSASEYSSSFTASSSSEWSAHDSAAEKDDAAHAAHEALAAGTEDTTAAAEANSASGQSEAEQHDAASRSASHDEDDDDLHAVSYHSDEYEVALPQDNKSAPHAATEAAALLPPADAQALVEDAAASHQDDTAHKQAAALDESVSSERRRRRRGPHSATATNGESAALERSMHVFEPAKVPTNTEELRTLQAENEELYERLYALQRTRCKTASRGPGGTMTATTTTSYVTLPSTVGPRGTIGGRPTARKDIAARLVQESLQLDRTMQLLRRDHRELRLRVADQEQLVARYESANIYHELVETAKKEVAALVEEQRDLQLEMRYNGKLLLMHETVMASGEGEHRLHEELRAQTALAQRTVEQALRSLEETERQRGFVRDRVTALRQELQSRQDGLSDSCWGELRGLKTEYQSRHHTAQQLQQRLARVREERAHDAANQAHPNRQTSSPTRGRGGVSSPRGRGARQKAASSTTAPTAGKLHRTSEEAERDYLQERIVYMRSLLQHRRERQGPGQYTEIDATAPSRTADEVASSSHRGSGGGGAGRVSFAATADVVSAEDDNEAADKDDGEEAAAAAAAAHEEQPAWTLPSTAGRVASGAVSEGEPVAHTKETVTPVVATSWLEDAVTEEADHCPRVAADAELAPATIDAQPSYPTEHATGEGQVGIGQEHGASGTSSHKSSVRDDLTAALELPDTLAEKKEDGTTSEEDEEGKDAPAWLFEEGKDGQQEGHDEEQSTLSAAAAAASGADSAHAGRSSEMDAIVGEHVGEAALAATSEPDMSAATSASRHSAQLSGHAEAIAAASLHEEQGQGEDGNVNVEAADEVAVEEVEDEAEEIEEEGNAVPTSVHDYTPSGDIGEATKTTTASEAAVAEAAQPDAGVPGDDADEEPDWLRF